MRTLWLVLAGAAAVGGLSYAGLAGGERSDATVTVVVTGSSTVAPLASEIGKRFEERRPGVRVDVQTGGSSRGIADARRGLADVGMVSRSLGPGESDLLVFPVARDGVALVVHADNPVDELSAREVRDVWTGRVEDWSRLGGGEGPITVVHKAEGRATLELFLRHFGLENGRVRPDVVVGDNQQGIRTVAGNPGAVGYVSIGEGEVETARGVPIRLLPLEGVAPTTEEVAAGRFPLERVLVLVTADEPTGVVRDFLEFSGSSAVHDLVRRQGFVPLSGG